MKKKFCKKVDVADLKPGDRVMIATPYSPQVIGYVESLSPMGESVCAYLDIRWRSRRAACALWMSDKSGIDASNKFKLVFNHDTLYVTNMKLNKALKRLKIKPYMQEHFDIPF